MEIRQFKSGAVAADGGTMSYEVELSDESMCYIGLDARIPQRKSEWCIFIGAGYPTLPGACLLEQGSAEEREVIQAIEQYIRNGDQTSNPVKLAISLLEAINERIDPPVKKSWLP